MTSSGGLTASWASSETAGEAGAGGGFGAWLGSQGNCMLGNF